MITKHDLEILAMRRLMEINELKNRERERNDAFIIINWSAGFRRCKKFFMMFF